MEELLPVVAKLAEKYTSKESSSITYETAQMLMEAVVYCIEEWETISSNTLWDQSRPSAWSAYQAGYGHVLEKVKKAKHIYHRVMNNFEDYGCRNYRDTIQKGMPVFFLRYDAKFQPQNHILMLDYPIVKENQGLYGVDRICRYLSGISVEKELLQCFSAEGIRRLLEKTEDGGARYMGNLCYLVLFGAMVCVIAEKQVFSLELDEGDKDALSFYFRGDGQDKVEGKVCALLNLILNRCGLGYLYVYFQDLVHDYSVRIYHSMKGSPENFVL